MSLRSFQLAALCCFTLALGFISGCDSARVKNAKLEQQAQLEAEKAAAEVAQKLAEKSAEKESKESLSPEQAAAKKRLQEIGATVEESDGKIVGIAIQDGSTIAESDIDLIAKLTGLKKLQVFNCRMLNDEMVEKLGDLKELTNLALTNSVINDKSVEFIVKTFSKLTDLDLSSNTNLTTNAMKPLAELTGLKSLTLVQNRFNELSTRKLKTLVELRSLDLRGNMEAGNMTLGMVGNLPKLSAFKHRSTAVTDEGMEKMSANANIESLLIQDFMITGQSGQHIAKFTKLKQLEVFRCKGFDTQGVLALKGLGLDRLTLRDLSAVDDQAMAVFTELPKLRRLYLHELESVSDDGLKNLAALQVLEQLDVWEVPNLKDATIEVLAGLPNLKELSLRSTGVTDASIETLLKMPKLQSLTFKENGKVSEEAMKKLSSKKWTKLDIGGK